MHDIATTANVLSQRPNPSGTAGEMQKIGEIGSLTTGAGAAVPFALARKPLAALGSILAPVGYNAAQYGIAKLMTSPKFVDWLMTPKPNEPFLGGAGAGALAGAQSRRP